MNEKLKQFTTLPIYCMKITDFLKSILEENIQIV